MTRNFQHLKLRTEKIAARRFLDKKIWLGWLDFELEAEAAKKFSIRNHRHSERVTTDWTIEFPLDFGDMLHVIDMSVRQKQKIDMDTERPDLLASTIGRIEK